LKASGIGKENAWIEQIGGIDRRLDPAHDFDLRWIFSRGQEVGFGAADAMLGTERAAGERCTGFSSKFSGAGDYCAVSKGWWPPSSL
jgi:hypothetical protein